MKETTLLYLKDFRMQKPSYLDEEMGLACPDGPETYRAAGV